MAKFKAYRCKNCIVSLLDGTLLELRNDTETEVNDVEACFLRNNSAFHCWFTEVKEEAPKAEARPAVKVQLPPPIPPIENLDTAALIKEEDALAAEQKIKAAQDEAEAVAKRIKQKVIDAEKAIAREEHRTYKNVGKRNSPKAILDKKMQ